MASRKQPQPNRFQQSLRRHFVVWLIGAAIFSIVLPELLLVTVEAASDVPGIVIGTVADGVEWIAELFVDDAVIAPLFTAEIQHWEDDIQRWSEAYDLDPDLLATVMQIESCGHPTISSHAGAQGLFQVMPFHFADDEDQLDPDTNAMRGAGVLNACLDFAGGDTGLAMACYNGGPSVIYKDFSEWLAEPQRYYTWGTGIYADAVQGRDHSATLDRWLDAGGAILCDMAAEEVGIR